MKAEKSLIFPISALCFAAILAGCSPATLGSLASHELVVVLPPLPGAWDGLPDPVMALAWKGPDGGRRFALAAPGSSLRIAVERGRPQAVLALPSSAGRSLLPAGALYPEALGGGAGDDLTLDWLGGYAASVGLALEGGGVDPWGYDLYKLAREAYARCRDPWLLAALETAESLARGEFRIDRFTSPARLPFVLPGPGPWSPESPFAAAPVDGVAMLPPGLWRYLGEGGELLVSVSREGGAVFLLNPEPGLR